MSNKRLIDGEKLLGWLKNMGPYLSISDVMDGINSVRFEVSSNQGEGARLREALFRANSLIDQLYNFSLDQTANSLAVKCIASIQNYREALSSHTEDTQRKCPACEGSGSFDGDDGPGCGACDSTGLYKEDTGSASESIEKPADEYFERYKHLIGKAKIGGKHHIRALGLVRALDDCGLDDWKRLERLDDIMRAYREVLKDQSIVTEDTGIQKVQGIEWIRFVPQVAREQIEENDYLIFYNGRIVQATQDSFGGFFYRNTSAGQVIYPYRSISHYAEFNAPSITDGGETE